MHFLFLMIILLTVSPSGSRHSSCLTFSGINSEDKYEFLLTWIVGTNNLLYPF